MVGDTTKTPIRMEDLLKNTEKQNDETSEVKITENVKEKKKKDKGTIEIPKGRPKSGRIWKSEKTRFSSIVKTKGIRNSFAKKQKLREELKRVKEASRAIIAAKNEEKEQKKQRRKANLARQEENRKKSEIVQVIKNPSKIKKMKKKQLRQIEKRDTTNM